MSDICETTGDGTATLCGHRLRSGTPAILLAAATLFVGVMVLGGERLWQVGVAGVILGATLFLLVARDPRHGMTLLIISVPLVSVGVLEIGWSVRPAQVAVLLLLVTLPFAPMLSPVPSILKRGMIVYVASLALSMLFGLWWGVDTGYGIGGAVALRASAIRPVVQFVTIALGLAVVPLTFLILRTESDLTRSIRTLVTVTLAITLYGLYQPIAVAFGWPLTDITQAFNLGHSALTNYGATRFYSGIVGSFAPRATFPESLHFGAYLAGVLPLSVACWLGRRSLPDRWRRLPWALLTLGMSLALLLTLSRSSWAATLVGLFLVLIGARRVRTLLLAGLGAIALYAGFLAFSQLPIFDNSLSPVAMIIKRLSLLQLAADPRWLYHGVLIESALSHPVFGVGLGRFALIGAARLGMETIVSAHSVWMAHWVEGGIIGLTALLGLFVLIGRRIRTGLRLARGGPWYFPLLGLSAGIVAMSFQYMTYGDRFAPHFWLIVALALWIARLSQRLSTSKAHFQAAIGDESR